MRLLLLGVLLMASPAIAQVRIIPPDAKPALMRHVQGKVVKLDERVLELSPGAQIRDTQNHIVFPEMLPPGVLVRYRLEPNGFVHQVWVLTPEEAGQPEAKR